MRLPPPNPCRRAHAGGGGGVGFLADVRRMNVALTRARRSLWIVGHSATLAGCPPWQVGGWGRTAGHRSTECLSGIRNHPTAPHLSCPLPAQDLIEHCRERRCLFSAAHPYDRLVS